jgi:hypothetical protein
MFVIKTCLFKLSLVVLLILLLENIHEQTVILL